jgi:hypothetical protein
VTRARTIAVLLTVLAVSALTVGALRLTARWAAVPAAAPARSGAVVGAPVATVGSGAAAVVPTTAQGWTRWVRAENALPATPGWAIPGPAGRAPGLEAYADRVSVRPGEAVGLYVHGTGTVRVRAFRIGDYGGGSARQVWSGTVGAAAQPAGSVDEESIPDAGGISHTHVVVADWHRTGSVDTAGWPEGDYLLRMDAGAASRYVPLTVRSADARGRVLLIAGAMTWQAYNYWGGGSLYDGDNETFSSRSHAVSFDRPYLDGFGSGRFLGYDAPIVTLAERAGLPLAWATDYDLANDPSLLDGAAAVVIGGHAEYWTGPMRDAVTAAVARGSNLAVFGANTAYWRVRLAGRTIGLAGQPDRRDGRPRIVVGAKDATLDPLAATDPGGATARFRDPPGARSEEDLTGMRYDCFPAETSWTVVDPTWWGYAGTGVTAGERLAGVVGPEADRVFPVADRPVPEEVVAYQPYSCGRSARTAHTGVYWVARSGAAVFAVGTMRWPCASQVGCTGVPGRRSAVVVTGVTINVLTAFAQPRAGLTHPARDNVASFPLPAGTTTHTG